MNVVIFSLGSLTSPFMALSWRAAPLGGGTTGLMTTSKCKKVWGVLAKQGHGYIVKQKTPTTNNKYNHSTIIKLSGFV